MKYTVAILLLLCAPKLLAQQTRRELRGKITASTSQMHELFVINRNTNDAVEVQPRGYFTILAQAGDTLMFSSTRFKARQITLKEIDFDGGLLLVEMQAMVALEEVVIERFDHINAVDLGIIPAGQKKYTPAESKLKTAGDLKPKDFIGLLGGGMPTDPIINAISGRTAQLKKELVVEKKESFIGQIEALFDEAYFTNNLKIPAIYVKGFLFFIVENDSFTRLLPQKNTTTLSFLMTQLAEKYLQTITVEKK